MEILLKMTEFSCDVLQKCGDNFHLFHLSISMYLNNPYSKFSIDSCRMSMAVYFACADGLFRKFDRSTPSLQTLMEFFIFGLDIPDRMCGSQDNSTDVSK